MKVYTNHVLYIDATLPRLNEPNYEIWLLRIFHPGINTHVTFGMVLIPREFLYSIKWEATCLLKVFSTISKEFEKMPVKKFLIATKRNFHFVVRIQKVITEKISPNIRIRSK